MFWNRKKTSEPQTLIGTGVCLDDPAKVIPLRLSDSHRKRHTFVFGTTGVGKTRLAELMIEQDIRAGKNIVFLDPKGDQQIFTKIFDVARQCGRESEMQLVTPIYPEYSAVIDPLAYYFMPDELVGHLVAGIKDGKEPFYRNIAKEVASAVITGNILLARAEGRTPLQNIDSVRQAIRRSAMEDMQQALDRISDPEAQSVAGMIRDILESPQGYYEKVSSTLRTSLNELSSGNIGQIIGKAESNQFIERMEQGKGVILVVHTGSMITREAGETLGRVVLSMIQSFVGRVYLSGRQQIDRGLSIYIDEAQSLFYKGVEDLFSKSGSAGVMVQAFAQSVNQLYSALGENEAKSILDNTNTKIFMRCTDAETSDYVVQHFGTKKVLSTIYNPAQITTREVEEDVLRVQHVLSLQPQDFYMMTYAGRHRGRTSTVKDSKLTIQFPDAPAIVRADREQGERRGD